MLEINFLSEIKYRLTRIPQFLLCILPKRKNNDLDGPCTKKFLLDLGIINGCISPLNVKNVNDQYLTNVDLKLNAKVGGVNSMLIVELVHRMPKIFTKLIIIIRMDVSHSSPINQGNHYEVVMYSMGKCS